MMRREWIMRALRTFVQAALGFAAANAAGIVGDGDGAVKNALAALTVASVAAGLAALMNLGKGSSDPGASDAHGDPICEPDGDPLSETDGGEDADE